VSQSLLSTISKKLSPLFKNDFIVHSATAVSGGCISICYKLKTNYGYFFLKYNPASDVNMFAAEAKGLKLIRSTNTIRVPEVIFIENDFLLLEYVAPSFSSSWINFGKSLADLHKNTNSFFGLDHDNFIGNLVQSNSLMDSWSEFYIKNRLLPQVNQKGFSSVFLKKFDLLFAKIPSLFPKCSASLIHGDLWSGNFLMGKDFVYLIDPAVYYGNREMDISMSKLFGGFDDSFYDSYNDYYPLENGWGDRVDLCNLYPLMVHVNLFGGSYYNQVVSILNKYI
tara:strand:- start:342 stop:1184 length:843 start_codon:yes stop_codon:yes gene_type:complete